MIPNDDTHDLNMLFKCKQTQQTWHHGLDVGGFLATPLLKPGDTIQRGIAKEDGPISEF